MAEVGWSGSKRLSRLQAPEWLVNGLVVEER